MSFPWETVADAALALVYLLLTVCLLAAVAAPGRMMGMLGRLSTAGQRWLFLMLAIATGWLSMQLGFSAWARVAMGSIRALLE